MKIFRMPAEIATAQGKLAQLWEAMWQKKKIFVERNEFNRVLSVLDLTFLGIGSMLGMGVYIMAGNLSNSVGPAMSVSFLLAGITATLAALCYAEFACRAPGTGSAYAYCYITIGEFMAFLLGWNLALEFVIGSACLARGLSGYLNSIFDNKVSTYFRDKMAMNSEFLSPYPDFLAFVIVMVFVCIVASGVRNSSQVQNVLVVVNIITISTLIIVGVVKGNLHNWFLGEEDFKNVNKTKFHIGDGGFMPYGISSVFEGAATCFYAYTGFDTVATTGNEAHNPERAIPMALMLSMTVAISAYTGISAVFTMMWPYYDQNLEAPFPYILRKLELNNVNIFITFGAISAILGCLLGSIFGLARVVYSIARDGLLHKYLSKVNNCTKTPLNSTMTAGLVTGIISIIFNAEQLINMTSIGTLMAYTMVGLCILILRYEHNPEEPDIITENKSLFSKLFNVSGQKVPSKETAQIARWACYVFCLFAICLSSILAFSIDFNIKLLILGIVFFLILVLCLTVVGRQPNYSKKITFKVKPVPLLPGISIFINIYLMMKLDHMTWIRFSVWLIVGLGIYFGYGVWNSTERKGNGIADGDVKNPK